GLSGWGIRGREGVPWRACRCAVARDRRGRIARRGPVAGFQAGGALHQGTRTAGAEWAPDRDRAWQRTAQGGRDRRLLARADPQDRSRSADFDSGDVMARTSLLRIAHARSGDKGDTTNVGLIARRPEYYPVLAQE